MKESIKNLCLSIIKVIFINHQCIPALKNAETKGEFLFGITYNNAAEKFQAKNYETEKKRL